MYHKLPKIQPPFLRTTLRQKWGGGICPNINTYAPLAIPHTIATTATAFWMNGSFDEHVLPEISCTSLKPSQESSKQLASWVVMGTTLHKFAFPVWATKSLVVASKQGYSIFVCACLQTQLTTELNQKLIKAHWENVWYGEEIDICVVCGILAANRLLNFSKSKRYFQKASIIYSKMLQIVYLCCHSFGCLRKQNLAGIFVSLWPCVQDCSFASLCHASRLTLYALQL